MYSIAKLFFTPDCDLNSNRCLKYSLHNDPTMQLILLTSVHHAPSVNDQVAHLKTIEPFNYSTPLDLDLNIKLPSKTKKNGTLFLHLYLLPIDYPFHISTLNRLFEYSTSRSIPLTSYHVPFSGVFQLLEGKTERTSASQVPVSHIKSEISFHVLYGVKGFHLDKFPEELYSSVRIVDEQTVLPIVHYDVISDRQSYLKEITNDTVDIKVKYSPICLGKMRLMIQIARSFTALREMGFSEKDLDQMKDIFTDANVYLLCVTICVSSMHLLFEFLALKNDVSFWKSRTSLRGLSVDVLLWKAGSMVVIFLYLLDEDAFILIVVPAGCSTIIEFWKLTKVFQLDRSTWRIKKVPLSEEEKMTQLIDAEGMKYLSYLLYPLCILSAIYSLLYQPHKGWYSWIIHSMVTGVYAFGFLFMLPQLFINYKLKSVDHLPWRVFFYKAISTFIDDLFAFLITMPNVHRLACFRDDVVFLIYLYQRWLYPVDKTRLQDGEKKDQ